MSRRRKPSTEIMIAASGLEALEHREALYLRLLQAMPTRSPIAERLHYLLTLVRVEMFART